ncbi:MAG: NosD domain-containing protein [Candidatus Omnitrophica bacterium]|nr:NosD domain-containing protein [Candidatus Omnitrophota bacterium]
MGRQYSARLLVTLSTALLLTSIFPLSNVSAANATPTVGTITPASGQSAPNQAVTFTATYGDANGWTDLRNEYLLINTALNGVKALYVYYDRTANKLWLRNAANTAWLGGVRPGSATVLDNGCVKLVCSGTTVAGSGAVMTVRWTVIFREPMSGKSHKSYLWAVDRAGASSGWLQKGTWIVNRPPAIKSISPVSGSSASSQQVYFNASYTDADGWQNFGYAYLMINTSISAAKACYVYYNRSSNLLYLMNDAGTSWQGGYAPGSANVMQNSSVTVDCAKTAVTGSGTVMTVKWCVAFTNAFSGKKYYSYMYAKDVLNGIASWKRVGSWTVTRAPICTSVTPASGSSAPGREVLFSTVYTDGDGWQNLNHAYLLINTSLSSSRAFYAYYNQNTNKLYLLNDSGSFIGGYAPGSQNVIESSYAKLDCSKTMVADDNTNMIVTWAVTFKTPFAGKNCTIYMYAVDDSGISSGWQAKGTWSVTSSASTMYYEVLVDENDTVMPNPEGTPGGYWFFNCTGGDRGKLNEADVTYSWDGDSSYTALVTNKVVPGALWTYGGMWYSLVRVNNDNKPLNFKKIFGPYIKDEYQGRITELAIAVKSIASTSNNRSMALKIELKDINRAVVGTWFFNNLFQYTYPRTFTVNVNLPAVENVKELVWTLDYAQIGDQITVDHVSLKAEVPDLTAVPSDRQAFYWTYSWLMGNYNPDTGMFKDKSRDGPTSAGGDDMESVSATAKGAKNTYYAYRMGFITYDTAVQIINKVADTLLNVVPRGPQGVNTLWPHFTRNGGAEALPPHDKDGQHFAGTEWSSGDTAFAALDMIAALQMIGDPQGKIPAFQAFLENIQWTALLTSSGFISHGYLYEGTPIPYDWRGFGMETLGMIWAYASSTGQVTDMLPPPSDNGSGFIDNAQYPVAFWGIDGWGNDWDAYRRDNAELQIGWYGTQAHYNQYLSGAGLFGLSAGEVPNIAEHPTPDYIAYGTGGASGTPLDDNGRIVLLHYAAMIADLKPAESVRMWETLRDRELPFLQDRIVLSPLNNMESLRVDKDTGRMTVDHLKGSWNLSLQAEGWAQMNQDIRTDLQNAVQNNVFLKRGYDLLREHGPQQRILYVPQQYATIQAAIDAAEAGDRIVVSNGTYAEKIVVNKSGINLEGQGASTVIQGTSDGACVTCENIADTETVIKGFGIAGGMYGILCKGTAQAVRIQGNTIVNNVSNTYGFGVYLQQNARAAIINNSISNSARGIQSEGNNNLTITGNTIQSCRGSYGGGLYLVGATAFIANNYIANCWDGGITLAGNCNATVRNNKLSGNTSWNKSGGLDLSQSTVLIENNVIMYSHVYNATYVGAGLNAYGSTLTLVNNVFYSNSGPNASAKGAAFLVQDTNLVAKNNIFASNNSAQETAYFTGAGTQDFSYNDFWNNSTTTNSDGITLGAGNLTVDPVFVDSTDFRLGTGSGCVDKGDPAAQYNDKNGTRNDMGVWGGPNSF